MSRSKWIASGLVAAAMMARPMAARADTFTGTLFYTTYQDVSGSNVFDVSYNYNSSTHALGLGTQNAIASLNGADGIMFAPNGNLLVTSNSTSNVYELTTGGSSVATVHTTNAADFHMALDPTGNAFYSSDRYTQFSGSLDVFSLNPSISNATGHAITGDDPNVTQLAYDPNNNTWYYTDSAPNGNGTFGSFNLSTYTTTRILGSTGAYGPAHGLLFDPFTGLLTMFGNGIGTYNPGTNTATVAADTGVCGGFDQGSLDGQGHAFIAGCNELTFIDYSVSGDITHPDYITSVPNYLAIDDTAPLAGLGSSNAAVPEPTSLLLLATGLAAAARRRMFGTR